MIITNHMRAALQQIATQTANSFQAPICCIFPSADGNLNEPPVFGGVNALSMNLNGFREFSDMLPPIGKPLYLNSLELAPKEFEGALCHLQPHAIESFIAIPMIAHDAVCGTLVLFFHTSRHFSENEILHLSAVANTAALSLDLARDGGKNSSRENSSVWENILTKSAAMNRVLEIMKKAAVTDANVLIFGESGVGKELIARGIHNLSRRHANAFIPVDCVALPKNLLESELFGIRVISATNRNPENAVREKFLREDLYFRLNVIPIYVPALRERKDDIPSLAAFFIKKFIHANGLPPKDLAPETTRLLVNYSWPGNVRELQNIMERVASLCPRRTILPDDLPANIRTHTPLSLKAASDSLIQTSRSWRENLNTFKHTYFKKLLEQTHGDIPEAARQAKVSPRTLYRLARKS